MVVNINSEYVQMIVCVGSGKMAAQEDPTRWKNRTLQQVS